jgi:hypothetical protein
VSQFRLDLDPLRLNRSGNNSMSTARRADPGQQGTPGSTAIDQDLSTTRGSACLLVSSALTGPRSVGGPGQRRATGMPRYRPGLCGEVVQDAVHLLLSPSLSRWPGHASVTGSAAVRAMDSICFLD